jgi:hypothetical protein
MWRPRVIALVALLLRFYSLANYVAPRSHRALGAIPFLFEPGNIAFSIANGNGFGSPFRVDTGPTAWMTPVYPGLIAGLFKIFGIYSFDAFLAAALLNILFSSLVCFPLYALGEKISGRTAAVLAALLWAIFPNALVLPYEAMWDASLAAFLATTILWMTVRWPEKWWVNGPLWGFTLMTTAALGAVLPFLLWWRRGRAALLTGLIAVLCCVPWTVRNYLTFHSLVPLRSVMGLSLWLGNNQKADGTSTADLHPLSNSNERAHFIEVGEIAYNAEKQRLALAYMAGHPLRTLELTRRRFVAIWAGGTPRPIDDFIRNKSAWFRWVLGFNLTAAIGAAAGIVILFRRRNPLAFPVTVFPLVFPLAYYVTLAPPRYRHPIDPVLLLLTAVTIQTICENIRRRPTPSPSEKSNHLA